MPNLFGIDIAGIIAQEIGPGVLDATLIVVTPGTRSTNSTAGTNPTTVSISGKGFIEDYEDNQIDGTLVKKGDRRITLIANTFAGLPVPKSNDKIEIENATYTIQRVKRDPAAATYTCQSRG